MVNNRPEALTGLSVRATNYGFDSKVSSTKTYKVADVPGSTTVKAAQIEVSSRITPLYFVKLDLLGSDGQLVSTNFYCKTWRRMTLAD